jgi:RNA polymerase sigma factor (sigma-70 family)
MGQKRRNTSSQRSANRKHEETLLGSDFLESSILKREIFLDYEHWQSIADNKRPWYEYNHSTQDRNYTAAIQRIIIPCINEIISSALTNRQKEVVTMYFLSNHTQVHIAHELGISQPTVSQHLNGKKRKGKKIGGSIRKIRKIIHRMSSIDKVNHSESQIINILNQLLDSRTSLRKSHDLLRSMLK